jgi:hypothetical protein
MPGSRQLVIFLGIGLVIVRYWTSGQRNALSSLWSAGSTTNPNAPGGGQSMGGGGPGSGVTPYNPKTGTGGNPSSSTCCRSIVTGENMGPVPASGKCPVGQKVSYLQA